jgi:hypothetical protein
MLDVSKTKSVMESAGELLVKGIAIGKHGVGIGSLPAIFDMLAEIKVLLADAPLVLPELKDLDQAEAGQVAESAYALIKKVMDAVNA